VTAVTGTPADDIEGWYLDPYGVHEDRWFSAGTPTALVRDRGTEAHDEPPPYPPPVAPVEAPVPDDKFPQDDFKRADAAEAGDPNAKRDVISRAFEIGWGAPD